MIEPPAFPLLLTALSHHQKSGWLTTATDQKDGSSWHRKAGWDLLQAVVLTGCLWVTGGPCISPWWRPLTLLLQQWPRLLLFKNAPSFLRRSGPLGRGCGKVCEVLAAYLIWTRCFRQRAPFRFGLLPRSPLVWIAIVVFSTIVNLVLAWWSQYFSKGRGEHKGVYRMVQPTMNRRLTYQEHLKLLIMAVINATCEEVSSRGFWMSEFSKVTSSPTTANFFQALAFGVWHYDGGIPSGWIGVALKFTYGFIMGLLAQFYDGQLVIPIIAHAMADYFIFAFLARRQEFWHDKMS
jgi:membrane protease YdiL (CAAX protease family)